MGVVIEISVKHPGGPLERGGLIYTVYCVYIYIYSIYVYVYIYII